MLGKASEIIKSNPKPNIPLSTKPWHRVPVLKHLSDGDTTSLGNLFHCFCEEFLPNIHSKPALAQLKTMSTHPLTGPTLTWLQPPFT